MHQAITILPKFLSVMHARKIDIKQNYYKIHFRKSCLKLSINKFRENYIKKDIPNYFILFLYWFLILDSSYTRMLSSKALDPNSVPPPLSFHTIFNLISLTQTTTPHPYISETQSSDMPFLLVALQ